MFAWRKRKPREEDQPLVPHGFLWQATEEPEATPSADTAQPKVSTPIKAIEVRSEPSSEQTGPEAVPPSSSSGPKKLGAISPPVEWPSPRVQEIDRRPRFNVSSQLSASAAEWTAKSQNSTPAVPVRVPVAVPNPKPPVAELKRPRVQPISLGQNLRRALLYCRQRGVVLWSSSVLAAGRFQSGIRGGMKSGFAAGARRLRSINELTAKQSRELRLHAVPAWHGVRSRVAGWKQSATAFAEARMDRVSGQPIQRQTGHYAQVLRQNWNRRVRVRIPSGGLPFRAWSSNAGRQWLKGREAIRRDSRLWMSMAMAGLSALLALGMISLVRSYAPVSASEQANRPAPVSAPTQLSSTHSAGLKPRKPAPGRPSTSSTSVRVAPKVQPPPALLSAKRTPAKPVTPAPAKRRVHHDPDEDFVARDTYVYYGNVQSRR